MMMTKNALSKWFAVGIIGFSLGVIAQEAAPAVAPVAEEKKVNPVAAMPEIVAQYGDLKITKKELLDEIKAQIPNIEQLPPEIMAMQIYNMAQGKISAKLLSHEAAKAGFKADKESTLKVINEQISEAVKADPNEIIALHIAVQEREQLTLKQYVDKIASNPKSQEMVAIQDWLNSKVAVTDEEVKKFYDENQGDFKDPADPQDSVRAAHIMIAFPEDQKDEKAMEAAFKKAEEIIAKVQKDATEFAKLAESESACPSSITAGAFGTLKKGQSIYGKDFEDAAFALKVGDITAKPVKSSSGYHVIRRDASKAEKVHSFDEVKERLKQGLSQQKGAEFAKSLIDKATADGQVKMFIEQPANMPIIR